MDITKYQKMMQQVQQAFQAQHAEPVSVTGSSGVKGNGRIDQARESYDPGQLSHGNDPGAMTREGARATFDKGQSDKREYHTFTFQNPANPNDFARTPVRISGKNGPKNETTIFFRDPRTGAVYAAATVGNYKLWGVGMNHVRYNKDEINRDLGTFRKYDVNGVIMTPSPTSGSGRSHRRWRLVPCTRRAGTRS